MDSQPYTPAIGDVWRKDGPCDWVRIVGMQWPGYPEYDGGLPGVEVRFSTCKSWTRRIWFIPAATPAVFAQKMKESYRRLSDGRNN